MAVVYPLVVYVMTYFKVMITEGSSVISHEIHDIGSQMNFILGNEIGKIGTRLSFKDIPTIEQDTMIFAPKVSLTAHVGLNLAQSTMVSTVVDKVIA